MQLKLFAIPIKNVTFMKTLLVLALLAASLSAHAVPRTSVDYTLSPETTNAGGSRTTSASYSHEGSLGEIGGFASVASPSVTLLGGYIGALDVVGLVPGVTTAPVTDLTETGATFSGEVTAEGGSAVTVRGFVVGSSPDPTVENDIIVMVGSGTGSFTIPVTDLLPGTTYHLRAYATSEIGTGYGANLVFTTNTGVNFTDGLATFARDILAGDRQVFHFTLAGPRVVSFGATGGASLRAELFDSEGNRLASFDGDSDFDLEQLLLAGNYVLHVFREEDGGDAQTFDLEIDASVVAASRPDVAVGASLGNLLGEGVYGSPAGQQVVRVSRRARRVRGFATVANRGNLPDAMAVGATRGNRLFRVVYHSAAGNVTGALVRNQFRTGEMDENDDPVWIRATVTPNQGALTRKVGSRTVFLRKQRVLVVRAVSIFDPTLIDAASIRVRVQ